MAGLLSHGITYLMLLADPEDTALILQPSFPRGILIYADYFDEQTLILKWIRHRPYVALFEQVLYGIVQDIAADFENQSGYLEAAVNFRVPYWDWLLSPSPGHPTMPTSISSSEPVQVTTANGIQVISNPLYHHQFRPVNSKDFPDYPVLDIPRMPPASFTER